MTTLLMLLTAISSQDATPPKADGPPPAKVEQKDDDKFQFKVNGTYAIWGLTQRNFFLGRVIDADTGRDHPIDDDDYVVQMFRLKLKAGSKMIGGVLRLDAGQGWWGVDNSPNVEPRVTVDPTTGDVTATDTYNKYVMFRNKETNYGIHVDHAFLYFQVPWVTVPIRFQVGRQYFQVGNKLVLDQDFDALRLSVTPTKNLNVNIFWAKVSEGFNSNRIPVGALMGDEAQFRDSDLFGGTIQYKLDKHKLELFGLFYKELPKRNLAWAHYPNNLGYFHSRFQPQVNEALALGVSASGSFDVLNKLEYKFEFDFLTGKDEIDNTDHAGNLIDINDGDLAGYNLYAELKQHFDMPFLADAKLLFGIGSGDDDPTSGKGNLNRIQTMGFFPLTNVWEDSVMPDVAGITPQGLGSPASRGYREFENTTAVQLALGFKVLDPVRLEASYTYLKATQPIFGWDGSGPTDVSSSDIGSEIDANVKISIYKNLKYIVLFGYFVPGDGAALLINGNTEAMDSAWEIKQVLVYKF